jgi:hypothetical protein
MGKQNGWCPFGLRLQIPVSPLLWRFRSTEPNCDSDAHVIIIAHIAKTRHVQNCDSDENTSLSSPPPRPTAPRSRGAPAVVQAVHDIPKDFSTAHQVPLDNETTHQVPSVVPLGRTFVSVSCTMSRALAKTRHAKQRALELRFANLAKTRHTHCRYEGLGIRHGD